MVRLLGLFLGIVILLVRVCVLLFMIFSGCVFVIHSIDGVKNRYFWLMVFVLLVIRLFPWGVLGL